MILSQRSDRECCWWLQGSRQTSHRWHGSPPVFLYSNASDHKGQKPPWGRAEGSSCHTYGSSLKEMHLLLQFYGNVGISWMLTVLFRLPVFLQEQGFFLPLTVLHQTTRGLALKFLQGNLKAVSMHMALPSISLSETQLFINLEMSESFSQDQSRTCHRGSPPFPLTLSQWTS